MLSHTNNKKSFDFIADSGKEIANCVVDGQTYMDGQEFSVKDDPSLVCHCMEGYKGTLFCRFLKSSKF